MNNFYLLAVFRAAYLLPALFITGCASTVGPSPCVCSEYFPSSPKPDWIHSKSTEYQYIQSMGLASCSGIQSMDFSNSDKQARVNLSAEIISDVKSSLKVKNSSYDGFSHHSLVEQTEINTHLELKESEIYARWVDPNTCTIYSAIRLPKRLQHEIVQKHRRRIESQIINQSFSVTYIGHGLKAFEGRLESLLTRFGIKRVNTSSQGGLRLISKLISKAENRDYVTATLLFSVVEQSSGDKVWEQKIQGKGVSFNRSASIEKLLYLAIDDAFEQVQPPLEKYITEGSLL